MAASEYVTNVCKIGQGADCCKYLTMAPTGWHCMKYKTQDKHMLDMAWAHTEHVAQADNCDGVENLKEMP